MRRLIAVATAATLLLASLGVGGALAAGTPNSHSGNHNFGHGHIFRVHVSPVTWAGGRIAFSATMARCDLTTRGLKVSVTTDLTSGTVLLNRAGTIYNAASKSRACVWRGATTVLSSASTGDHVVTFSLGSIPTVSVTTRVIDHTTGTDGSSGS